jgi:chromosome segregation ATPase
MEFIVRTTRTAPTLLLLAGVLSCCSVSAQTQRSGGGVNAQLAEQYQQAVAERNKLQADNAKLKSDLDDANKHLKAAQQQLAAAKLDASSKDATLAAAQSAKDTAARSLEDLKAKAQELVGQFRQTVATLKGVEIDRSKLQQQLTQSREAFDRCADRNYQLYQINGEILDRYAHQGAFSYLARAEPFTRIKRTQIENLAVEYRQRAEELRVEKQEGGASAGATAPTPAAVPPGTAADGK